MSGSATMKRIQRITQRTAEVFGRGEKSDKLTAKLAEIEKKVDGIRNGCQITTKRVLATFVGSGSTMEKHQKKIPQYSLGLAMMESGAVLEGQSLFGDVIEMVGQAQLDIAAQMSQYEISVMNDIVSELNTMLEEDMKKVDKAKKKLGNARLDMDSARTRLKAFEHQIEKSSREYNMEKLLNHRQTVDETSKCFDDAQDAYATEMFDFLSKEQVYTKKIQELVMLQITHYKNAATQLETMLPTFEKKMNASLMRPVFGVSLDAHLSNSKRDIAMVLEVCCTALRESCMDTEGLFRIAAGSAKVKFLKSGFDAGQTDVSAHDAHTIAGCLKMYLRELAEPLLTYDLYSEWIKAAGVGDYNDRLQLVWSCKEKLPQTHLNNLKYLMAFLHEFAQYSELTKMTVNNIAIVIGPNLLWPREESADPLGMVTDTAMQRRITELLIEQCHWFFPDLPETPQPILPTNKPYLSVSPSNSFSSSQSVPPLSPRGPSDTSSLNSVGSTGSSSSPITTPVLPKPRERSQVLEKEPPHPLADNALSEGVTVQMVDSKGSSNEGTPSPKVKKIPPPVAPYKPVPSSPHIGLVKCNSSDPPSPVPKPRHGSASSNSSSQGVGFNRTSSAERPDDSKTVENGKLETTFESPLRPTPSTRLKRPAGTEPPTPKPIVTPTKSGARGPSRRAPPPPVSKKPSGAPYTPLQDQEDEFSAL